MADYMVLARTKDLSHEEWLQYRMQGIGGSDAAAIVGLNPYRSAVDVYADKLGFTQETVSSEAMRQGADLEGYTADRFAEATGKKPHCMHAILQSREHPFMLANIDRKISGEDAGLECKTTSPFSKVDWESGEVPSNYYVQCQHYCAVSGYPKWYLAVLVFSKGFYWYEIERNEDDIAALIQAEEAFWKNVREKVPPEPDGSQAASSIIRSMYDGSDGGEVTLTGITDQLERYEEIKNMIKSLNTEKEQIEQKVQLQMGNAHIGRAPGWRVDFKPVTSKRVDTKWLKAERPDIAAQYSKASTSRRFAVKKEEVTA